MSTTPTPDAAPLLTMMQEALAGAGFVDGIPAPVLKDLTALAVITGGWDMRPVDSEAWPGFAHVHTSRRDDEDERAYWARDKEFRRLVWPWWVADQLVERKYHYELWKKEYQANEHVSAR